MTQSPTNLERKIMILVCEELTNKEIANKLNRSERTISKYKENIFHKFDLKNSVGIAVYSIKNKIYEL